MDSPSHVRPPCDSPQDAGASEGVLPAHASRRTRRRQRGSSGRHRLPPKRRRSRRGEAARRRRPNGRTTSTRRAAEGHGEPQRQDRVGASRAHARCKLERPHARRHDAAGRPRCLQGEARIKTALPTYDRPVTARRMRAPPWASCRRTQAAGRGAAGAARPDVTEFRRSYEDRTGERRHDAAERNTASISIEHRDLEASFRICSTVHLGYGRQSTPRKAAGRRRRKDGRRHIVIARSRWRW
jgi:hypothetical protein